MEIHKYSKNVIVDGRTGHGRTHCHSVEIPKDSLENETSYHSRVVQISYAAHDFPENSHLHEVGRVRYNRGRTRPTSWGRRKIVRYKRLPVTSVSVIGAGIDRKFPLRESGPDNFVRYKRVSVISEIYCTTKPPSIPNRFLGFVIQ